MLTQERLKEVLNYDPESGIFTWKVSLSRRIHVGDIAGGGNGHGYIIIGVDGVYYMAHRLAVLYIEGYLPETTVDHKDRVRDNNRWDNLREATYQCQSRNRSDLINNTSGITGVSWNKPARKWIVNIAVDSVNKHLGLFDDILEAACVRFAAEQCLGFQDCDINSSAKRYIKEYLCPRIHS